EGSFFAPAELIVTTTSDYGSLRASGSLGDLGGPDNRPRDGFDDLYLSFDNALAVLFGRTLEEVSPPNAVRPAVVPRVYDFAPPAMPSVRGYHEGIDISTAGIFHIRSAVGVYGIEENDRL